MLRRWIRDYCVYFTAGKPKIVFITAIWFFRSSASFNNEKNTSDSIFSSRGGYQSHQSTDMQPTQRVAWSDEPNLRHPSDLHAKYRSLEYWQSTIRRSQLETIHHLDICLAYCRLVSAAIKDIMEKIDKDMNQEEDSRSSSWLPNWRDDRS